MTTLKEEANNLLAAIEAQLITEFKKPSFSCSCHRRNECHHRANFLLMGIREKTRGKGVWVTLSFVSMLLTTWLLVGTIVQEYHSTSNFLLLFFTALPLCSTLFILPSTSAPKDISIESIDHVVRFLQERNFNEIGPLRDSINLFERCARSRTTTLKWLAGLVWAGFFYVFTHCNDQPPSVAITNLYIAMFLGTIAVYLCVWGYEASVEKVFSVAKFGCNELERRKQTK